MGAHKKSPIFAAQRNNTMFRLPASDLAWIFAGKVAVRWIIKRKISVN